MIDLRIALLSEKAPKMRSVHRLLQSRGHEVVAAADAPALLELLKGPVDMAVVVAGPSAAPTGGQIMAMARAVGFNTPFVVVDGRHYQRTLRIAAILGNALILPVPFDDARLLHDIDDLSLSQWDSLASANSSVPARGFSARHLE